jgi:ribosomal protein S18 acetylase RimI-like enzyme
MLYLALFVAPGRPPFPREIVRHPDIARYVQGWGREHDIGVIAVEVASDRALGAAWLRLWSEGDRGFGYVDGHTPELSMAVVPECRGQGVGTHLLSALLHAADAGYPAVSLSVAAENPAVHLYRRFGFDIVGVEGDSLRMRRLRGAATGA